jgi:hypothetical protein
MDVNVVEYEVLSVCRRLVRCNEAGDVRRRIICTSLTFLLWLFVFDCAKSERSYVTTP